MGPGDAADLFGVPPQNLQTVKSQRDVLVIGSKRLSLHEKLLS